MVNTHLLITRDSCMTEAKGNHGLSDPLHEIDWNVVDKMQLHKNCRSEFTTDRMAWMNG